MKFEIPQRNIKKLREKIGQLSRRAVKLGVDPITMTESEPRLKVVEYKKKVGINFVVEKISYHVIDVEITGMSPSLAGWDFVARIEDDINGTIIKTAPNAKWELPQEFRTVDTTRCDHCKTARKDRNAVFVIRKAENGEWAVVGSTCLRDFMGTNADPETVAQFYENMNALMKKYTEYGGRSYYETFIPRNEYLFRCAFYIRKDGWVSSTHQKHVEETTGNFVHTTASLAAATFVPYEYEKSKPAHINYFRNYDGSIPANHGENNENKKMTDEEYIKAKETTEGVLVYLEEFLKTPDNELDDFGHNLKIVLGSEFVSDRRLRLAAAIYPNYWRSLQQKQQPKSSFVGEVSEKIELDVTFRSEHEINTTFGTSRLLTFNDGVNWLKWFTQKNDRFEEGRMYRIRGTVKRHDSYQGKASTIITRVKVLTSYPVNSTMTRFSKVEVA